MAYNELNEKERFADYREFLYENGGLNTSKGASIDDGIIIKERGKNCLMKRKKYFYFWDKPILILFVIQFMLDIVPIHIYYFMRHLIYYIRFIYRQQSTLICAV